MTAPFVTQLRARDTSLDLSTSSADAITVRVQMPETWDTLAVRVAPGTPVMTLKTSVLDALYPTGEVQDAFVLKLRGWEVLDEAATVADVGARDGSIFLLTHRRRRAVR